MPTRSTYVVLIVLIGVGLLFAGSLNAAYQATGQQYTIDNESHVINYTTESSVDAPAYTFSYNDTITVTANGSTLTAGTDYEWNASVGNITWLNSTQTANGDNALVDYGYQAPTEDTYERRNILASLARLLPYAALAVGVYAAIQLTDSGW
jgi:hypothetical protein